MVFLGSNDINEGCSSLVIIYIMNEGWLSLVIIIIPKVQFIVKIIYSEFSAHGYNVISKV